MCKVQLILYRAIMPVVTLCLLLVWKSLVSWTSFSVKDLWEPQVLLWWKELPTVIRLYILTPILIYDSFFNSSSMSQCTAVFHSRQWDTLRCHFEHNECDGQSKAQFSTHKVTGVNYYLNKMPVTEPVAQVEETFMQDDAITWPIKMLPLKSCDTLRSDRIAYTQPSDRRCLMGSSHARWALLVNES